MIDEQMTMMGEAPASVDASPAGAKSPKKPQRKSYGQMLMEQEEEYKQWKAKKAAERQKQLASLKPKHDKELADWVRSFAGEYIWPERLEQILEDERVWTQGADNHGGGRTLLECLQEACRRAQKELPL